MEWKTGDAKEKKKTISFAASSDGGGTPLYRRPGFRSYYAGGLQAHVRSLEALTGMLH